jgi:hypothetical protein
VSSDRTKNTQRRQSAKVSGEQMSRAESEVGRGRAIQDWLRGRAEIDNCCWSEVLDAPSPAEVYKQGTWGPSRRQVRARARRLADPWLPK